MKNHTKIFWFILFHTNLFRHQTIRIRFDKANGFIRVSDGTRYLVLFGPKNMMPFTIGLNIL